MFPNLADNQVPYLLKPKLRNFTFINYKFIQLFSSPSIPPKIHLQFPYYSKRFQNMLPMLKLIKIHKNNFINSSIFFQFQIPEWKHRWSQISFFFIKFLYPEKVWWRERKKFWNGKHLDKDISQKILFHPHFDMSFFRSILSHFHKGFYQI